MAAALVDATEPLQGGRMALGAFVERGERYEQSSLERVSFLSRKRIEREK